MVVPMVGGFNKFDQCGEYGFVEMGMEIVVVSMVGGFNGSRWWWWWCQLWWFL